MGAMACAARVSAAACRGGKEIGRHRVKARKCCVIERLIAWPRLDARLFPACDGIVVPLWRYGRVVAK